MTDQPDPEGLAGAHCRGATAVMFPTDADGNPDHVLERMAANGVCPGCPATEGCRARFEEFVTGPRRTDPGGVWFGTTTADRQPDPGRCAKGHRREFSASGRTFCPTCRRLNDHSRKRNRP